MDSSLLPALLARQASADGVQLLLHLSADLPWFAGHFPGAPLLPGVTQLQLAIHFARTEKLLTGEFQGMDQLKFQRPLRPDDRCWLILHAHGDGQLRFEYRLAGTANIGALPLASSGRVQLS
ncbi:MAG: 3-hydroxyacyl-ACP dehydratase FabZ family protein [Aeromonas sp.]